MNILICEDNALIALDLAETLNSQGHTVEGTVTRSTDCLEQCSDKRPDLVLVDLNLADGCTGLELVDALAEQGIPSVIVSSEARTVPASTPAKAVLEKPLHSVELEVTLERLACGQASPS